MLFSSRPYCSACIPKGFLLSGLLLCLLSLPLSAQQATLERLWTGLKTESRITDFAASGDVGYVASPRGLEVYDLTTPRLQLLSTHELIPKGEVRLRVADDTLLLAWDADTGVSLFSIADRLAPRFLKHIIAWKMEDADAKGDQLFIAWRQREYPYVLQVGWKEEEQVGRSILRSMGGFRKVLVKGEYVYALGFGYDNDEIHIARLVDGGVAEEVGSIAPSYLFISDFTVSDSLVLVLRNWNRLDGQVVDILRWDETGVLRWGEEERLESGYIMESLTAANDSLLVFYGERSLLPGQMKRTLLSGQIVSDTSIVFLDTLESGLVRDQVGTYTLTQPVFPIGGSRRRYLVTGDRLMWRDRVGVYTGLMDGEGRLERGGDVLSGELSYDVSGIGRNRVFVLGSDTLYGMDFSDPSDPKFLSRTPLRAEGLTMVNRERLITFDTIVRLFDVSDPAKPKFLDSLNLGRGRTVWRARVGADSVIVLCCLEGGTVVLVMRGDRLYKACEIKARSSDALWMEEGWLLTTRDTTDGKWVKLVVEQSAFEWASADRLKVWGKTGLSLTKSQDTLIVANGDNLEKYSSGEPFGDLAFITYTTFFNPVVGIQYANGRLYGEHNDFGFQVFDPSSLQEVGIWGPSWLGDGRFYLTDSILLSPETYHGFQVFGIRFSTLSVLSTEEARSRGMTLSVAPNMVDERTTIQITLSTRQMLQLSIYNARGVLLKEVASSEYEAGEHRVDIETGDLPSGTYWVLLEDQNGKRVSVPFRVVR